MHAELTTTTTTSEPVKPCCRCGNTKTHSQYNRHRLAKDGLQSACKVCQRLSSAQGYRRKKQFHRHAQRNFRVLVELPGLPAGTIIAWSSRKGQWCTPDRTMWFTEQAVTDRRWFVPMEPADHQIVAEWFLSMGTQPVHELALILLDHGLDIKRVKKSLLAWEKQQQANNG